MEVLINMAGPLTLAERTQLAYTGCNVLNISPIRSAWADKEVSAMRQVDPKLNVCLDGYTTEQYIAFLSNIGSIASNDPIFSKLQERLEEQSRLVGLLSGGNQAQVPVLLAYIAAQNMRDNYNNALNALATPPKQYTQLPPDPQPQNP